MIDTVVYVCTVVKATAPTSSLHTFHMAISLVILTGIKTQLSLCELH